MPDPSTFAIFAVAALALLVTPGPSVIYIVARSLEQGRRAGLASVLGITTGTLIHVLAAALGLSALVLSSVLAFSLVKYAGAAYLIYLGLRKLFSRDEVRPASLQSARLPSIFGQGVLVNVLNPKTALFILAFLPQFVDVSRGHVSQQILLLGATLAGLGLLSDGAYALLAGKLGNALRGRSGVMGAQRWLSGVIYLALGLTAAFSSAGKG